eukprot:CAMPEP_0194201124 /NCGR_PEP_ID=MMETSP0156-20130528/1479_1 /TAXON_ID=33649 /ORGANISM="Thalassionema nitzschioides, Strain L26-B" /LENGTH=426 /DNA_ID=CAMNT_0038926239 /DNA_START=36 /DNA_END=1314 /DNA_ORIENTATION=+
MKIFTALSILHFFSAYAIDSNTTNLSSKKVADLENGAEVILDVVAPQGNSTTFYLESGNLEYLVPFGATAQISIGAADVHYIYIMDTSGSTEFDDGHCGTTLRCEQKLLYQVNNEIRNDESALAVSFIAFDDDATPIIKRSDPQGVDIGLSLMDQNITPGGGTACNEAFVEAEKLVKEGEKTVIIFSGDGMCDDDAQSALASVENKGAIVHTIAVGDNINCTGNTLDSFTYYQYSGVTLGNLTTSEGRCFDIPDPNNATEVVQQITLATLSGFEIKIDGEDYKDIPFVDLSDELPQDHPKVVTYAATLSLEEGEHNICFRATGQDVSGKVPIEDCRRVSIQDMTTVAPSDSPSEAPSEAPSDAPVSASTTKNLNTGAVVGILFAVIVVGLIAWVVIKRNKKENKTAKTNGFPAMDSEQESTSIGEV